MPSPPSASVSQSAVGNQEAVPGDFQWWQCMRSERDRLRTYTWWPNYKAVTPGHLAGAGFFYTGSGDRVQCAFCTNILCDWEPGDDPMFEHRWHFPGCEFVLSLKATNEPFPSTEQHGEV